MSSKRNKGFMPGQGPGNGRRFGNGPPADEGWIWFTREMLASPAWRGLTLNARRVIDRILIEHMSHAGTENGNLVVTFDDFAVFGVRRQSIHEAIEVAKALGWIAVTRKGGRSIGGIKRPSVYRLTFLPQHDGSARTNDWRRIVDDQTARRLVDAIRREMTPARRSSLSQDIDRRGTFAPREEPRLAVVNGTFPSGENAPGKVSKLPPVAGAKVPPGKIQ